MYKLLLCWRYLRTRYIALASIISVTLGVATMIVVNSVMEGFGIEMRSRLHGIYSDLIFASPTFDGMRDAAMHERAIRKIAGDDIEATSPTVVAEAILNYQFRGAWVTRQVELIGIDENTQGLVSDFSRYLQHPENRKEMSFMLREGGYDVRDHQAGDEARERTQMAEAGWPHRRDWARAMAFQQSLRKNEGPPSGNPPAADDSSGPADDPFRKHQPVVDRFDPAKQQHTGAVIGIAMVSYRTPKGEDCFRLLPGEDVKLTFPTVGQPPKAASDNFTVVDFYESKMAEYDAKFVFVPIRKLQELRGMIDPTTGVGLVNAIQIRLKPGVDGNGVRDKLRKAFDSTMYQVSHLARHAGPLADRRGNRDQHPQRAAVPDHRRGRVRHPRHLLHDRRREDPRHRHPQIAGGVGHGRDGDFPELRAVAGGGRRGSGNGNRAIVRPLYQRNRRRTRLAYRSGRCSIRRSTTSTGFPRSWCRRP